MRVAGLVAATFVALAAAGGPAIAQDGKPAPSPSPSAAPSPSPAAAGVPSPAPVLAQPPGGQPAAPPPAEAYPPGYGPPPGYAAPPGQPPPGYGPPPGTVYYPPGYRPRYGYAPPPPPPPGPVRRGFTIGFGVGVGALNVSDSASHQDGDYGLSYSFRLGFGVAPSLILLWDIEGTDIDDGYGGGGNQTAHLFAVQFHPFAGRLFVRGGVGGATASSDVLLDYAPTNLGLAWNAALGFELLQGWHTALDIEFTSTWARYTKAEQTWNNNGLNFCLSWY